MELEDVKSLSELKKHFGERLPKHVGLILDGNRRWIRRQGITDIRKGHIAGYKRLKKVLYPFFEAGIHYLSAYALSTENVAKRSDREVRALFKLILRGVEDVLSEKLIHDKKVKVRLIGKLDQLPIDIQKAIEKMNKVTENYNDNHINFCVMYDGQEEIVDAVKKIAQKSKIGKLDLQSIS